MENKDKLPKNSDRQTYRQPDNQTNRQRDTLKSREEEGQG